MTVHLYELARQDSAHVEVLRVRLEGLKEMSRAEMHLDPFSSGCGIGTGSRLRSKVGRPGLPWRRASLWSRASFECECSETVTGRCRRRSLGSLLPKICWPSAAHQQRVPQLRLGDAHLEACPGPVSATGLPVPEVVLERALAGGHHLDHVLQTLEVVDTFWACEGWQRDGGQVAHHHLVRRGVLDNLSAKV